VRAQLHVRRTDPDDPSEAALHVGRALLAAAPRRRPLTLCVLALAPEAGLTPTPWVLDGLLEACEELDRGPIQVLAFGDHDAVELALAKVQQPPELRAHPSGDRSVPVRVGPKSSPVAVPREVIGSAAILVAPLALQALDQTRARGWRGPVDLALEALASQGGSVRASAWRRGDTPRELAARGLDLLSACFASTGLVVDATWSAATRLERPRFAEPEAPRLLGELAATERVLGVVEPGRRELEALLGASAWMARRCGLRVPSEGPSPELLEIPGRWPELSFAVTRSQPRRLADRAISGIRSARAQLRPNPRPALAPRIPGRFARLWTERWYAEPARVVRTVGR
jgi:hypothetical protein